MANENDSLFVKTKDTNAIICVDASGSTCAEFKDGLTIFGKMAEKVASLGHDNYRILFWNSPQINADPLNDRFKTGVFIIPFVVKAGTIKTTFMNMSPMTVKELDDKKASGQRCYITGHCLTEPHLGFNLIPDDWLKGNPIIYLFTDGNIGYWGINNNEKRQLKSLFANSIRNLSMRRNKDGSIINANPRISIIAVENVVRDLGSVEAANNAAGGDMFAVINEEKLTNNIRKFITVAPNGEFVQINRNVAQHGFIPYEDKQFHTTKCNEFMAWISNQLKLEENKSDDAQLRIAQNLSSTLNIMTHGKPKKISDDIVRSYSRLFRLDENLVKFILTEAIERERGGQAGVFASYRQQLKNLFKQADDLLKQNVASATGMNNRFVSFIYEKDKSDSGRILTGSSRLIDGGSEFNWVKYPNSSFKGVSVMPLLTMDGYLSDLNKQCIRQWIRAWYAKKFGVHPTADEIIYLVLGDILKVVNSGVDEAIKNSYRRLGMIMLEKKRLNLVNVTEYGYLILGEYPTPNSGKVDDFIIYMNSVIRKLHINTKPMKLWYQICLALNQELADAQRIHCREELNENISMGNVELDVIPDELSYDYECIVTLNDLSQTGGWRFLPHNNAAGNRCSPAYLLSDAGHDSLLNGGNCICYVCYAPLSEAGFEKVGPKKEFELNDVFMNESKVQAGAGSGAGMGAGSGANMIERKVNSVSSVSGMTADIYNNAVTLPATRKPDGTRKQVVVLHGVVGAGKSHLASEIEAYVKANNGVCFVEGTDKYAKTIPIMKRVINKVMDKLKTALSYRHPYIVAVIDTCGEYSKDINNMVFFNVNFSGWERIDLWPNLNKDNLKGYFAWSLRNVLLRGKYNDNSNYYLNPIGTSIEKCISVHKKKADALFPDSEVRKNWDFSDATVESLKDEADKYGENLPKIDINAILGAKRK